MILEKIKNASLAARKAKEALAATLLTTLYSEAVNVGKNNGNRDTTDAEAVAVVKKFLKGVDETISYLEKTGGDNATALTTARSEKEILLYRACISRTGHAGGEQGTSTLLALGHLGRCAHPISPGWPGHRRHALQYQSRHPG